MTNKIKIDRIYNGDCLKLLKKMEPKSVDLIMTSSPYADNRKDTYGRVSFKKYDSTCIFALYQCFRLHQSAY